MANVLGRSWSGLVDILFDDARMVVQVFLVTSGYLVARSLAKKDRISLIPSVFRRYLRLLPSYVSAIFLTITVTSLMRDYFDAIMFKQGVQSWLPAQSTWTGFLGHLFLLQNVLHLEALTVGVWYVSIDLQLFILTLILVWLADSLRGNKDLKGRMVLVCALSCLSLWVFNLDIRFDNYAVYFFGAYGMGMLSFWATQSSRGKNLFYLTTISALGSFSYAPRTRLLIAIGTAVCLYWATRLKPSSTLNPKAKYLSLLSDSSYALFLNHFSVIIVMSGCWFYFNFHSALSAAAFIGLGWALSFIFSLMIYKCVEQPFISLVSKQIDSLVLHRGPLRLRSQS